MTDPDRHDDDLLLALRHGAADDRARLAALAAGDAGLQARLTEWDRQDEALRVLYGPVGDEPVPDRHRALLAAAAQQSPRRRPAGLRLAAAVALIAAGAAGGWIAARQLAPDHAAPALAAEALRAYATYSVEVRHPVEVTAADQPHLTTWLSKRIGHPITPPLLEAHGLRLIGGRVVPDANGTAALLMYEDVQGKRVTLYVAPVGGRAETSLRFVEGTGVSGFWWVDESLGCAVIGPLPRAALQAISASVYEQLIPV